MVVDDPAAALAEAMAEGRELDLGGTTLPASVLVGLLTAPPPPGAPALRLRRANLTGILRLTGATVTVPVELRGCRFVHAPDLRMAELIGLALTGSHVPGLRAGNLRVGSDLCIDDGFVSDGPIQLTDAHIGGSLRMSGGRLRGRGDSFAGGPSRTSGGRHRGHGGHALVADRIQIDGTWYARRLRAGGELRLPGARITGNVDLAGAELASPTGDVLDASGITVGGTVIASRHPAGHDLVFEAAGRVLLPGARIGGDLILSGARIACPPVEPPPQPPPDESRLPVVPGGIVDATACLVADRVRIEGNLELDDRLSTSGTVRLPNAVVGGYLRLSGARLAGPHGSAGRGIALLGDGMEVAGDLEARDSGGGALACVGQIRLVDAKVRGGASLSGVELALPDGYALLADRLQIGGDLYLRGTHCAGTIRLESASIGSTLDCAGAVLERPRLRRDNTLRPSLDARKATIGKDLLCVDGFTATGGVRIRGTEVGKSVEFARATLGPPEDAGYARYALNAYGLIATEIVLEPAASPRGAVRMAEARVGRFTDSAMLWTATGGVDIDGFEYEALNSPRDVDVRTRLRRLCAVMPQYAPRPYEQLAAAYRRAGEEERAERVLMESQRRRYAEAGRLARVWGTLQRWTVGYGYRPWLAVAWLVGFWLLGGTWFAFHELQPVDDGQHPVWNPWLYAADTLLPIVNLGEDGYWRVAGASQWIASTLIAAGWVLATTAAAGLTRILKRV